MHTTIVKYNSPWTHVYMFKILMADGVKERWKRVVRAGSEMYRRPDRARPNMECRGCVLSSKMFCAFFSM